VARFAAAVALATELLAACGCSRHVEFMDAAGSIREGWQCFRLGEFDRAAQFFESVVAKADSADESRLQALYGAACVWNLRRPGENPEKAEAYYRRVVEQAANDDLAAWSALALARMKHLVPVGQEPDYPAVRKAYQEVVVRYPGHLAAKEAFIYLQATKVATLDSVELREAARALSEYARRPGERHFLQPAFSLLAVCHQWLGEQDQRLEAEILSLENTEIDPANPYNEFAWAYWNIATIAEFECGDFETARRFYRRLLEEYPTDIRVFTTKQALKRMDELEGKLRAGAGAAGA
jgi:tetratricopeptide (TPR) repeat protein